MLEVPETTLRLDDFLQRLAELKKQLLYSHITVRVERYRVK